jgi:hypothetical protein
MKYLLPSGSALALLLAFGLIAALTGCAATPSTNDDLTAQRETSVQGEVASIDRSPMSYDGDGLLVLSTRAHGAVTVHIPARSNLCKAQGLALFNTVTVGTRMRATGTATGPADISVCVEPTHGLKLLD